MKNKGGTDKCTLGDSDLAIMSCDFSTTRKDIWSSYPCLKNYYNIKVFSQPFVEMFFSQSAK